MKRTTAVENCLPHTRERSRGSTPRTQRLCEEVATRFFGTLIEMKAASETFVPSENASPWQVACERFVHVRDRLTPYIRPDDLLAGAFVRGDTTHPNAGWHPAGEDWYLEYFSRVSPIEPAWVYDMAARGLISPQGPFNHKVVDYAGFLRMGSLAVIERAEELLTNRTGIQREITQGFIESHACMIRTAERYAEAYEALAHAAATQAERTEHLEMARICHKVPAHPAETFHEALQMLWFAYMVSSDGTGRPDQYLYEYYHADKLAGRIDDMHAQALIEAFMIKLHGEFQEGVCNVSSVQTMTLGGCDAHGKDACNDLTRLFLQAIRSVRLLRPTVYIRSSEHTPQDILELAATMLGEGLGEPNFFGDVPMIEGLTRVGASLEDARDYALSGCAEVVSPGKGNWGAPNGWINIALLTLEALHEAAETKADTEGFWAIYGRMCDKVTEACEIANRHVDENCDNFRFEATIMYPCCLERGLDCMRGGMDTYYGHWEGCGLPNAADMVYAAQTLSWEGGTPLADLLYRLEEQQDETLIQSLRKLPKYGNDHAAVDGVAARLIEMLSASLETRSECHRTALLLGHLAGGENMHIAYGRHLPATLDGRRAGQPLADSLAGSQGQVSSPTAAIQSLCRIDHSRMQAGNVSTLRMTPADFATERDRRKVAAMVRTYLAMGGSQLQINVLDPATLRAAQQDPEQYAGIIVRVAGYSSAFDGLAKVVQDEIIARYEALE